MEYTIQKLAGLAGVSTRTLRYYDEIGLLKPARISSSGYRIYGEAEIKRLQQILFYRELDVDLAGIRQIIDSPAFDERKALQEHHEKLVERRSQLELLIANVEKTIDTIEGRTTMSDKEKFEGFKQKMLEENEAKYGKEIRKQYGDKAVDSSYQKVKNMTQEQADEVSKLSNEVNEAIRAAFENNDPSSELAQKACALHKKWLMYYWPEYSKEMHMALVQGYVDDPRFTAYYDKIAPGCAVFLRDAMKLYLEL
ncbi:MerR family transcriptional regulator [Anaerobium acetethylicum]|uniref:DNA-binding transcriptional regulator, MerR family n=1 Tax=Anaerobium acetethylicum TaxID=1619234 RepID=A0A1D3TN94_9FIRM|nr:MerR family transcriptional regulator [Anaerobium acetethylicum]SCP94756.1 DNA-binding transcriptional regulator, MerR family [Anaerobium acetethylicum]